MKSPTTLKLTLMMGAAATLTACADAPPDDAPSTFTSVVECQQSGFPQDRCQAAYDEAFQVHSADAPKFSSKEECERSVDVDQCVQTQVRRSDGSVGDVFVQSLSHSMGKYCPMRSINEMQSDHCNRAACKTRGSIFLIAHKPPQIENRVTPEP